ncbi:hypothetical protein J437_LFUL012885 [Ladona fulva]|uniref:Carboxylesterase type B domain-containing protein n=1 Tax=Ladona fulva TaxID=123851 RepID=A0A8K0P1Q4_LADFU|nr:hypothetical protein J437_LFUL012885 [Ladona fulva]
MNGGRLYPGEELAARGAVVVTFNYRLGPFGFLSTGEPSCRGNWGLLDQAEALRWVRRNAKVFGGDALSSLCLVGNSAGAASVLLHMVSPVTKGRIRMHFMISYWCEFSHEHSDLLLLLVFKYP